MSDEAEENILVFSQGRSGGGTIQFALSAHVPTKIIPEKLNHEIRPIDDSIRDFYEGTEPEDLPDGPYVERTKEKLKMWLDDKDGIKHVINNFSYVAKTRDYKTGLWHKLDKMVIDHFDRVIINDRKNWLKWAISFEIADYTSTYGVDSKKEKEDYLDSIKEYEKFRVNVSDLRDKIHFTREEWNKRIRYIENSNIPHFYLTYENLYNCPFEQRIKTFKNALKFLDLESEEISGHVEGLFSRERKVSGKDSNYHLIENIDEINDKLGPEFGFLY